ncbi:hypothetical protein E3O55_08880 [Cryobacterium sp. MDB1-18-2]|uniref:DUF6518 family protein n=1 Tax=unclassified Cryobacterium TaxID=2649013 RepID=UPI00106AB41D|nr:MULTISPECIES: DUF6518 family protein [unclassified Cryobacterium]TFC30182.1 hypothetical protein E3O55_08880 [Cryobacterium sp. MDB1-18-2]TFC41462.1 hypothetical protein E3O50_10320 [Cryobacterium sp. MDB1-18-1]
MTSRDPLPRRRAVWYLVAAAAGVTAGALARLLFAVLPAPWDTLANTSALWGLVPFLVTAGFRVHGRAAAGVGAVGLLTMVSVWVLLAPQPAPPRILLLWGAVGVAAGALCGWAGALASSPLAGQRIVAAAIIGGLVLGEGLYGIVLIGGPQWWCEALAGAGFAVAWGVTLPERLRALGAAALVAAALFAAFLGYDAIAAG